jgi:elongator complex protein 5
MSSLLGRVLYDPPRPHQPLLLVQSSIAQSSLPILRQFIIRNYQTSSGAQSHSLVFCLLHPPSSLVGDGASHHKNLQVYNRIGNVPGYVDNFSDPREEILSAVNNGECGRTYSPVVPTYHPNSSLRTPRCDHRFCGHALFGYWISSRDL